jgi:hypothetical protein
MITRLVTAALLLLVAGTAVAAGPETTPVPKVELASRLKMELEWPEGPRNREALVMLQFDVLVNGKAANIRLAEGGFHEKRFVDAATQAVKYSRWQPKRIDGKPVDTVGRIMGFRFTVPDMEQGITAEFRNELVKVDDLLKKGDFAGGHFHAEWMVSEVVKLSYEYAVLQAQLAETYANLGKIPEAAERAWKATARPSTPLPEFFQLQTSVRANKASNYLLPQELIVELLGMRMRLSARQGLLADAMLSYYELAGLVELPSTHPLADLARELTARIQGTGNLVGNIKIGALGGGRYFFSRHRFTLEKVQGTIKTIDMKCSAGLRTYEYRPGMDLNVPAEWGGCLALFEAEPGTTFDIVEYPDGPAVAPVP